mmetsp:Transcript_26025/g.53266  ORF Transcript_26025/g.53266 Transcript_26025/m.53266 type:complete len:106 (-) Transcript_26025:433-750(-)
MKATETATLIDQTRELSERQRKGWGFFLLGLTLLAFIYLLYLLIKRCKARHEEEETRAQVDVVLSDMQGDAALDESDVEDLNEIDDGQKLVQRDSGKVETGHGVV